MSRVNMESLSEQLQSASSHPSCQDRAPRKSEPYVLVSVVMPCLNEARTLAACIEQAHAGCQAALATRLQAPLALYSGRGAGGEGPSESLTTLAPTYEIIIADNGSSDGSPEIAAEHGARVVAVEQKGYGAALLGGIAAARGKYVVMGDSDCSYDFGEVPRFLEKLEEGYDLVMGNRFAGEIKPGAMPWHHRYIGNPVLSGIGRILYRTPCRDWHCGLRAFNRQKINNLNLKCFGMEFASEMVVRAAEADLRIYEIPITLHPDGRGRAPHLRSFRDGCRHLHVMLVKLIILNLLLIVCGCSNSPIQDTLVIAPTFADLGEVAAGTEVSHRFQITNGLNTPLKITAITPSCSCIRLHTEQGDPDSPLLPGKSLQVSASLIVSGSTRVERGGINVVCDTPRHEVLHASTSFSVQVVRDYVVKPEAIDLGAVEPDSTLERIVELDSATDVIHFVDAQSSTDKIRVDVVNNTKVAIRLKTDKSNLTEQMNELVYIRTTSKIRPVVAIPVSWELAWDWRITPPVLAFTNKTRARHLTISTSRPSRIVELIVPIGFQLQDDVKLMTENSRQHKLHFESIEYSAATNQKSVYAAVKLSTDGRQSVVMVPLVLF